MIYKVAIIGCGNIGYRHLQGLAQSVNNLKIFVVDPDEDILSTLLKSNFLNEAFRQNKINFLKDISDLPSKVNIVIVATTSNVRYKLTEQLLKKIDIEHLILEKIVFQSTEDFLKTEMILKSVNTKVWINFIRRKFKFYQKLKKEIGNNKISIYFNSNDWGLACNGIHYIDLLSFITNKYSLRFNTTELDKKIYPSKRKGFSEFKGKLVVSTDRGDTLTLIDEVSAQKNNPLIISYLDCRYDIYEDLNQLYFMENGTNKEISIEFPYISELTGKIVDEIIKTNNSILTPFDQTMKFHIPMIESFNNHISITSGENILRCPIT